MSLLTLRHFGALTLTLAYLAAPLGHAAEPDAKAAGKQAAKPTMSSSIKPVAMKLGAQVDKKAVRVTPRLAPSEQDHWRHHGVG